MRKREDREKLSLKERCQLFFFRDRLRPVFFSSSSILMTLVEMNPDRHKFFQDLNKYELSEADIIFILGKINIVMLNKLEKSLAQSQHCRIIVKLEDTSIKSYVPNSHKVFESLSDLKADAVFQEKIDLEKLVFICDYATELYEKRFLLKAVPKNKEKR